MNRNTFQVLSAEVIPVSNIVYSKNGNIDINATIADNLTNVQTGKKRSREVADINVAVPVTVKKKRYD